VIICWWADSREKSTVGVEIDRVAENEWDFRFNNGEYAGAFFETNQGPLDPVEVHNANAIEYQSKGKFNEAINEYREALRINPDASEVRGNLGLAYYGRGNTDDAIREWKEALRIDPGCLTAQYNLGVTYRDQGRMEEALACFQEFVRRATPEWDEFAKQVKKDIRKIERIIRSD
jgi:tetratricopeptide (TPR) repeat protein